MSDTSPVVKKVLRSGLIDKATVELMEMYGMLPSGASNLVNEKNLENATRDKLEKLAEDLAVVVERDYKIRETHLDLERIRWPAIVDIQEFDGSSPRGFVATEVSASMDQMGRYYFRFKEAKESWFVPGYKIIRKSSKTHTVSEVILEPPQILYKGETPICYQVSVMEGRSA